MSRCRSLWGVRNVAWRWQCVAMRWQIFGSHELRGCQDFWLWGFSAGETGIGTGPFRVSAVGLGLGLGASLAAFGAEGREMVSQELVHGRKIAKRLG